MSASSHTLHPGDVLSHRDLNASILSAEQRDRLHRLSAHQIGPIEGLDIRAQHGGFVLDPGLAVDGFGFELHVRKQLVVTSDSLGDLRTKSIDIFIVRHEVVGERHVAESVKLRIRQANEAAPSSTASPGSVAPRLANASALERAQHVGAEWEVFLGTLQSTKQFLPTPRASRTVGAVIGRTNSGLRIANGHAQLGSATAPCKSLPGSLQVASTTTRRCALDRAVAFKPLAEGDEAGCYSLAVHKEDKDSQAMRLQLGEAAVSSLRAGAITVGEGFVQVAGAVKLRRQQGKE